MTKEEFLADIDDWCNHRILLWDALEATKSLKKPILELGCGHGSTPFLQRYCAENGLELRSYDYDHSWALQFGAKHVTNWDSDVNWKDSYSVVLIDESPGEHRKESLRLLARNALIIVIHDSEPEGWNASDYQVRPLINKFLFRHDLIAPNPQAWATALSNFIDLKDIYDDYNYSSLKE